MVSWIRYHPQHLKINLRVGQCAAALNSLLKQVLVVLGLCIMASLNEEAETEWNLRKLAKGADGRDREQTFHYEEGQ